MLPLTLIWDLNCDFSTEKVLGAPGRVFRLGYSYQHYLLYRYVPSHLVRSRPVGMEEDNPQVPSQLVWSGCCHSLQSKIFTLKCLLKEYWKTTWSALSRIFSPTLLILCCILWHSTESYIFIWYTELCDSNGIVVRFRSICLPDDEFNCLG